MRGRSAYQKNTASQHWRRSSLSSGSMLMDREAILVASEMLTGDDFYQHQYKVVYEAMLELFNEGKPVGPVTLQNRLQEKDVPPGDQQHGIRTRCDFCCSDSCKREVLCGDREG